MKLLTTKKDIIANIAEVTVTGKKLEALIHLTAASIVQHVDAHHDVTLVNDMMDALPKGVRTNALRAYFEAVAKVRYNQNEKKFVHDRSKETKLELAVEKSWVEYKPEPPYNGFDLKAAFGKLLAKAQEAQAETDDAKKAKIVVVQADLDKMKKLADDLGIELKAPKPV